MSRQPTTALPIPTRSDADTPDKDLFYSSSVPRDGVSASTSGSARDTSGAALLEAFGERAARRPSQSFAALEKSGSLQAVANGISPVEGAMSPSAVTGSAALPAPSAEAIQAHRNKCKLVVQKFGGTSVGTADRLAMVADIVR